MWQALNVVHRKPGTKADPRATTWKTCLRELDFYEPHATDDGHRGFDAHRFLVEICSGLHSPLFGETEVFGQFRAFRAAHSFHPLWDELFDAVEEDVRKLRRTHLVDIGSQSYGSLARRHLPEGENVVIVGGGRLAVDLVPWLEGRAITTAVRSPEKAASLPQPRALAGLDVTPSHWLIAAPISNDDLLALWSKNPARIVLDFRGEAAFESQPSGCERYFALRTLYAELESVRELHARKLREALAFAVALSARRAQAVVHRPFGWEDAFA